MSAENDHHHDRLAWKRYCCPTEWCAAGALYVKPDRDEKDLWHVAADLDESAWAVASLAPVCPLCGATLIAIPAPPIEVGAVSSELVSAAAGR